MGEHKTGEGGGGGAQDKFYPYQNKGGGGAVEVLAIMKLGGTTNFEVVLIQNAKVLAILKGECKKFPLLKGEHDKFYPFLGVGAQKVSDLRFSPFCSPPPPPCN